jgi:hypothetical protein
MPNAQSPYSTELDIKPSDIPRDIAPMALSLIPKASAKIESV